MEAMDNLYEDDQAKSLNLSLAINVADYSSANISRTNKRKRSTIRRSSSLSSSNINNLYDDHESLESKVLRLLQTREQMLRQGNKRRQENNGGRIHLIHLLLAAAAAAKGDSGAGAALDSLREVYAGASLAGDTVQRVAAHFADALAGRLLTRRSPFFHVIMSGPTAADELSAFVGLYRATPLFQFAHFTANQAIVEAFEENIPNDTSLHVIDFNVSYGFQWPSLIQSLAAKRVPSLRITGFGRSAAELRETEERLSSFSKGFRGLSFGFTGALSGLDDHVRDIAIGLKENIKYNNNNNNKETLAVNLVLHDLVDDNNSARLLEMVRSLNPKVVVLVEREVTSSSFAARFVESLHYFAAMFDSLDDSLPADSAERLGIEKNHLGTQIKALLNRDDRRSTVVNWREKMESHGFRSIKMTSKSVMQAKLLLKMRSSNNSNNFCGGFRVFERDEGMAISLGWQNRYLITASVWH